MPLVSTVSMSDEPPFFTSIELLYCVANSPSGVQRQLIFVVTVLKVGFGNKCVSGKVRIIFR